MVTESTVNGTKWSVFTLAAMAMIAGIILQCYGLSRTFQVDPGVANREGVASADLLGPYLDCDRLSQMRSEANTTGQADNLDRIFSAQCKSKQSPYIYLWAMGAFFTFMLIPFLAWAFTKETRGPILLSAIYIAVTMSLLLLGVYAYLHALPNNERMVNCSNVLSPEETAQLERQKLGRCVDNSTAFHDFERARRTLLSGIILNLLGTMFLSWLLPWIFHLSKVRVVLPGAKEEYTRPVRAPSETVQATPTVPTTGYPATTTGTSYV